MRFWVWLGRKETAVQFATKLFCFVMLAGAMNHLRAVLMDGPDHHTFGISLFDAAFVAIPLGSLGLLLLLRLSQMHRALEILATTDQLTSLPNRRTFFEAVNSGLKISDNGALLMADADFFKRINDTYGHGVGDACLIQIAQLLQGVVGPNDTVARLGGEEFALFLPNTSSELAVERALKISAGVEICVGERRVREQVTLSVGIAWLQPDCALDTLMGRADEALYSAKSQGRACVVEWDSAKRWGAVAETSYLHPKVAVAG